MWGLFVGIAIGMLQVLAMSKIGGMVLGDKASAKLLGSVLFLVKMAAIIFILYLISTITLAHLIWTAGGMAVGLILASVYVLRRRHKTDGEDSGDGE
ncbi:MAG: hypothetical protein PHO15_00950 [Eubacteriales bacterium]|nr:hypothetical protein [Eubacteriales bacterium]